MLDRSKGYDEEVSAVLFFIAWSVVCLAGGWILKGWAS